MPFESKDIRAVYDSLTVDPLFGALNKPPAEEMGFVYISPNTFKNEVDYFVAFRQQRLKKMYADMKLDWRYNTALKYV